MAKRKYIILGGGMAAGYAAKELAQRGLKSGELTIISADDAAPYERPPLSKGFLAGKDTEAGILINSADWYRDHGIDVRLNTVVETVDLVQKTLRTAKEELQFDNLLIATGARPRTLNVPGNDLAEVFYLRSMDDSRKIRSAAEHAKRAVVIGSGFIGMEVAAVLTQKKVHTTLIFPEERVWKRVFTPEMSRFFERYYTERGVEVLSKSNVVEFEAKEDGNAVSLEGGRTIPCDVAIAGIGAAPVTELFTDSGILGRDGVEVNQYLETAAPGVYAAGDVANYPDAIFEKRRRVEHWDNAVSQGQHWARVVTGDRQPFLHVPYFFSDIFDLSYEFWGDSDGATQTVVRGDLRTTGFSVWWLKGERLIAAFAMNRPDDERQAAPEWIQAKKTISPARLAQENRPISDAAEAD
jgi:NADPH-dependent 2,4-dienoyl-CoA reductase/sulfur reductase-like enzyme